MPTEEAPAGGSLAHCPLCHRIARLEARVAELENERLRRRVAELEAALKPFAEVMLPDNWPAHCILTWEEHTEHATKQPYPVVGYLRGACGSSAPTVGDYRRAREAAGGKHAEGA